MTQTLSKTRPIQKPGFGAGLISLGGAMKFLAKEPESWPVAIVPTLVFLAISSLGAVLGSIWLTPHVIAWLGLHDATTWYAAVGRGALGVLSFLLSGAVGVVSAFFMTPTLSAPALERLVALQEGALNVAPRREQGWIAEFWCGLKSQVLALAVSVPILLVLAVLQFAVPPAAVILAPLQWLVICLAVAWNLLDTPLTLRGIPASARIGLLLDHRPAILGFGAAFAVLFLIPCLGIVLLPVGAVAATRLVHAMTGGQPERLLPPAKP
jgi:CysZ protein